LKGGVLYLDGQFDDTRLLIDILKTAESHGAVVLNYAKVNSISKNAEGRINGVVFEDVETGEHISVSANTVINATGAFCSAIQEMSDAQSRPVVTYSQGIHLVFDQKFLPRYSALMIPKTSDGRVLFCIPWHDHLLVGTTDTPVENPTLEPEALRSEIDFVLETVGEYLTSKPAREDILSAFAGIRPLVKKGAANITSKLSRSHDLFVDASGLVTITGGKWTTYRQMAEDVVNKAIEIGMLERRECVTAELPIAAPESRVSEAERLHPDLPYTHADVVDAVQNEMARTVEDILARRTRGLFLNARAAIDIAETVAGIMANELSKDSKWISDQVEDFHAVARYYCKP
jgi:glycerol-3-phosphate dehydrogenase